MKKVPITPMRPTTGQWKQVKQTIAAAAKHAGALAMEKGNLDHTGMQMLLVRGDELRQAVQEATLEAVQRLSLPHWYANEEVPSSYGYLSGYTIPKTLAEQVAMLRELFPQLL